MDVAPARFPGGRVEGGIHVALGMRISVAKIDIATTSLPIERTHREQKRIVVRVFADEK